jgi:acyl carrier protein
MGQPVLDYSNFSRRVCDLLELDAELVVGPYDELYATVGLDSLQGFQLLVIIEVLADVDVPPEVIPEIYTMQDAYEYYSSLQTPT